MRSPRLFAAAAVILTAPFAFAQTQTEPQPQNLGGPGESCRARADCRAGLKCVNEVCTSEHEGETCAATSDCGDLKCVDHKCTSGVRGLGGGSGGGSGSTSDWMKFNPLDGSMHPFAGFALAGGFDTVGITGSLGSGGFNTFDGAFLFALQAGAFIGNHQLSFEIAPVTHFYDLKASGPIFEMSASYAYFIPLTDMGSAHLYWPLRFGLGMAAGPDDNIGGLAYFQMQADLLGVAAQVGHLIVDFHLPSFRYLLTDKGDVLGHQQAHVLDWLFGTSVGYAF